MDGDRENQFWIRRGEALGKAQGRYLWFTFLVCLFYGALLEGYPGSGSIKVPVVNLEFDAQIVLVSGGPVIACFVLVVMGSIRAWSHALEKIKGGWGAADAEALDMYPNAIDLAVYTTAEPPGILQNFLGLSYPLYLTVALVESAMFLGYAVAVGSESMPWLLLYVLTVAVWCSAMFVVLKMWRNRILKFFQGSSADQSTLEVVDCGQGGCLVCGCGPVVERVGG